MISLKKTELYDHFKPYIFSAVEVGTPEPKPSPNVYRHAIGAFGVDPRQALVIEDSPASPRRAAPAPASSASPAARTPGPVTPTS